MTAQIPDELINDSTIDLTGLHPFLVRSDEHDSRRNAWDAYPIAPVFPADNPVTSFLWRGCVATLRLHEDLRLELVSYRFPLASDNTPVQECRAFFSGTFHIVFKRFFFGPSTIIPFRDGRLVSERSEWQIDPQRFEGVVVDVQYAEDGRSVCGLLVDVGVRGFAPDDLVAVADGSELHRLVGKTVLCSAVEYRENKNVLLIGVHRVVK